MPEGPEIKRAADRIANAIEGPCIAGLGNYLRSEILFIAGVHPRQRPSDLGGYRRRKLCHTVKDTCVRAYETRGVTLNEKTLEAIGRKRGRRRNRHYVFGRDGRDCYRCGSTIARAEIGGRRIYVCPMCQPEP